MSKTTAATSLKTPNVIYTAETFLSALHMTYEGERIALTKGGHFERTPMLVTGAPGSAKTAIVSKFVKEVDKKIRGAGGKGARLVTLRLTQCEITDLKGVPKYIEVNGKAQCTFASPNVFPIEGMPDSAEGYDMNIIFFDELQQALPALQQLAAAVMDGTIGDHRLDMARTYVVACANRVEDNATVFALPNNLANRFIHGTMEVNSDDWISWAMGEGQVNSAILGFLNQHTSYLAEPAPKSNTTQNQAWATPRTWAKLSQILSGFEATFGQPWIQAIGTPHEKTVRNLVKSTVGHAAGTELMATAKNIKESINVNDIEGGKFPDVPAKPDVQFAVMFELISRCDGYLKEVNKLETIDIKKIQGIVDELDKKDISKLENSMEWITKNVAAGKMNRSMAAIYRGAHTTLSVKAALQILGKKSKKIEAAIELQKNVVFDLSK